MRIHREQKKEALKIYKQNVLDTHEEATLLKHEMGKLQDDQAKHLQLQTKEFERNKNNIERSLASAALEKLRLNQRLRKLKKINGASNKSINYPQINVDGLNSEEEIARAMRKYDEEMKNVQDPNAAAARLRLQRRLQLRQHQLKEVSMNEELNDALKKYDDDHRKLLS
jgi:hypothetical protein